MESALSWRDALDRVSTFVHGVAKRPGRATQGFSQRLTAVEQIEQIYGVFLPPRYREFLLGLDGWTDIFRNASLFNADRVLELASHCHAYDTRDDIEATDTNGTSGSSLREDRQIIIGGDDDLDVVFVLDATSVREDGEMDVIAWLGGVGVRQPDFYTFVSFLSELGLPLQGERHDDDSWGEDVQAEDNAA